MWLVASSKMLLMTHSKDLNSKKNIYLFQPQYANVYNDKVTYWLPYSIGCLASYVSQFEHIQSHFDIKELFFKRDQPSDVVQSMESPSVCGFSCYMWNEQYCLAVAKAVKENNADIGFGFDGDGDRVGVIDNEGNEIFSDKIGLLIARNLSTSYKNSKFIVDVKSTGLFENDKILKENNCETIYWKTGHSHIKRKVHDEKALAGFEKSGHFFFNQPLGYGYDDGINSAIQVCHLLDNQNLKMNTIIEKLPKTFQSPTMAPFCKDSEKYKVVDNMIEEIKKIKDNKIKIDEQEIKNVLTINGVRFSFKDGSWGLIRASSNKPSLVVVTESPSSKSRMKKIFDFIDSLLKKTGKIGKYDQKI